ncbi:MAG TPA: methyl-accepting chemotaxis protein, partial [Steroidobacteraceae bacterium]
SNEDFTEASGFLESELIGKAHNIVRHPDMPEEAFARLTGAAMALLMLTGAAAAGFHVNQLATLLRQLTHRVQNLTEGSSTEIFEASGEDEIADLSRALQSLRTKVGCDIAEMRRSAARIRNALDVAPASILVADRSGTVIYANQAVSQALEPIEARIAAALPHFQARELQGFNIDELQRVFATHTPELSAHRAPHRERLEIVGRTFDLAINPITQSDGTWLGTVFAWTDRTQELRAEAELKKVVDRVLHNDFTLRVPTDGKQGFYEVLSRGLNRLLENTASMVRGIQVVATDVHRGAGEIAGGNSSLAKRTEAEAAALEQTAASMEEMTSAVKHNADNAQEAQHLATTARDLAEKGSLVTEAAARAMDQINGSSKQISDIIGVINEIAFQTNLLALNAAVEAARAGELGRGFAIVATEVRNLAGRSATAAKQIEELITDSVKKVEDGSHLVIESGETLREIFTAVKKVSDIVAEISAASREQHLGIEQVNQAIMQMEDATQQNAALVEQSSAASQALAEQAGTLDHMMAQYLVDGSTAYLPQTMTAAAAQA